RTEGTFAGEQTARAGVDSVAGVSSPTPTPEPEMTNCLHRPACPSSDRPDRNVARVISSRPEQGWSLLCNGVIVFDDLGELLPDDRSVSLQQPAAVAA
ncbi:MAG TPA: DUF5999 family protein, partial [Lapillicoccus sp.]